MLKESGEGDNAALEMTLEHLGVKQERVQKVKPLTQVHRLRHEGRFQEAELILNSLLAKNPSDVDAALMLMRVYARDLRQSDKAYKVLSALRQQPHVSAAYLEFAHRSILEWNNPQPEKAAAEVLPESVDDLLSQGYFGTAIETLEQEIKEQPANFGFWMKLLEAHCRYCANFPQAEKILRRMESNFDPEQIHSAKSKVREWREAGPVK
jgi:tetratricopeptide (TPR) repeat protein